MKSAEGFAQGPTIAGGPVTGYRWVVAGGIVAMNWAMSLPFISLGILLPAIRDSFELSDTQAGWLGSSLLIGNTVAAIPAAVFFSRFNARKLAIAAIGLGAGFTFLHGLAPVFAVLLLARTCFGLSYSIRNTVWTLLIQLWHPLREVPLVNGIVLASFGVSEFVGLVLTPVILDATDWRTTYYIFGAFGAFILALWALFGRDQKTTPGRGAAVLERAPVKALLRYRHVWLAGAGLTGAMFGWSAFATFWPTYMLEAKGVSLQRSAFLFGLSSAASIPASLLLGYYASRLRSRKGLLVLSGLGIAAASAGMLLTADTWALALLSMAAGLSWGFVPITYSMPYEIPGIQPREVSVNASLITTLLFAGGILGPIVVGVISDATGSLFGALMVSALAPVTVAVSSLLAASSSRTRAPTGRPG